MTLIRDKQDWVQQDKPKNFHQESNVDQVFSIFCAPPTIASSLMKKTLFAVLTLPGPNLIKLYSPECVPLDSKDILEALL